MGKAKCDEVGVRGYPTIKYGDPDDLQDYKGGRTLADLQKFAAGLGPQCGPAALDLCDADKKAKIQELTKLSGDARDKMIKEKETEMEKAETDFKTYVEGLQKTVHAYEKKQKAEL